MADPREQIDRLQPKSSIGEAAQFFQQELARKRRPKNTIASYLFDLTILAHQIPGKSVQQVTPDDITRFLGGANSPATRKRRLTTLRQFYRYLIDDTLVLSIDPTEGFFPNRIQLRTPDPLTAREQRALLAAAAEDEAWSLLAIVLMMHVGLSRGEILDLERGHIDRLNPSAVTIRVVSDDLAKPNQNRMLRADGDFGGIYERFLSERNPENKLFPVGFQAVNGMVERVRRAAGLRRSVTPRTLRETFTVLRAIDGATEDELIRELGLADEYRNRQSVRRFIAFVDRPLPDSDSAQGE